MTISGRASRIGWAVFLVILAALQLPTRVGHSELDRLPVEASGAQERQTSLCRAGCWQYVTPGPGFVTGGQKVLD